jgi:hypothetical protein
MLNDGNKTEFKAYFHTAYIYIFTHLLIREMGQSYDTVDIRVTIHGVVLSVVSYFVMIMSLQY